MVMLDFVNGSYSSVCAAIFPHGPEDMILDRDPDVNLRKDQNRC